MKTFLDEHVLRKNRLELGKSNRNACLKDYKTAAKDRNLKFLLTEEQFDDLVKKDCYYCGNPPFNKKRKKEVNGDFIYNGIDRLDNSIGYTIENVVPCCKFCNRAKMTLTTIEFFYMVEKIYERFLK